MKDFLRQNEILLLNMQKLLGIPSFFRLKNFFVQNSRFFQFLYLLNCQIPWFNMFFQVNGDPDKYYFVKLGAYKYDNLRDFCYFVTLGKYHKTNL